jgi:hypothetical protein
MNSLDKLNYDAAEAFERLRAVQTEITRAMTEFLAVHSKPRKKDRQPLMGEEMKLTRTLAPRLTLLAMHRAMGCSLPPLILTYTGQRSGAQVHQLMKV